MTSEQCHSHSANKLQQNQTLPSSSTMTRASAYTVTKCPVDCCAYIAVRSQYTQTIFRTGFCIVYICDITLK